MIITDDLKKEISNLAKDMSGFETYGKIIAIVFIKGVKCEVQLTLTSDPDQFVDFDDVPKFDYENGELLI